jgi:hypothetical protein
MGVAEASTGMTIPVELLNALLGLVCILIGIIARIVYMKLEGLTKTVNETRDTVRDLLSMEEAVQKQGGQLSGHWNLLEKNAEDIRDLRAEYRHRIGEHNQLIMGLDRRVEEIEDKLR